MNTCLVCGGFKNDHPALCLDCIINLPIEVIDAINKLQNTVQQLEKENQNLQDDSNTLMALEQCGVDNWSGYGEAMDYLENGWEDE